MALSGSVTLYDLHGFPPGEPVFIKRSRFPTQFHNFICSLYLWPLAPLKNPPDGGPSTSILSPLFTARMQRGGVFDLREVCSLCDITMSQKCGLFFFCAIAMTLKLPEGMKSEIFQFLLQRISPPSSGLSFTAEQKSPRLLSDGGEKRKLPFFRFVFLFALFIGFIS